MLQESEKYFVAAEMACQAGFTFTVFKRKKMKILNWKYNKFRSYSKC